MSTSAPRLLMACCAVFLSAATPWTATQSTTRAPQCIGTLVGAEFPDLVPAHVVWGALFSDASRGMALTGGPAPAELDAFPAARQKLIVAATEVERRVMALRGLAVPEERAAPMERKRDIAVADLVLQARDDLVRDLTDAEAEAAFLTADTRARRTSYTFDVPGELREYEAFPPRCAIDVEGRTRPHLIPELAYWEAYFLHQGMGAIGHGLPGGAESREYITGLQTYHLPIPYEEVAEVVATAAEVGPAILARRSAAIADGYPIETRDDDVRRLVLSGKMRLFRALPRQSWAVVHADVLRVRGGTTYTFPAQPAGDEP